MYIETVPNRNSRPAVLLREGWREGGRVRKRTLANLTDWPAEKVQCLRQVLKGQLPVSPEEAFTIERSLPHGHVEAVLAMTRRLGLDRLIAPKRSPERDRVLAMVVGRLLHPGSKLAATRRWHTTTCLPAGYLEWHLRRGWAPLLFDDETLADDRRTRDPVAAAKPTARARHKKASRRTDDGQPLHSLDTLLGELATRCRNTCRVPADPSAPPLSVLAEPTPTQRRAARLIESFPVPGTSEG